MNQFIPDYRNIVKAATNIEAPRLPLYEHNISISTMEKVMNVSFAELINGDERDLNEFFHHYCNFFQRMGYDIVSFECCIGSAMPESGCLGGHKEPTIRDRADFERYPWEEIEERYFKMYSPQFRALTNNMPAGMKAIGGVGNGIFECVQDVVSFMQLCYISMDDRELYQDLFQKTEDPVVW